MTQELQHMNFYRYALLNGSIQGFEQTGRMTLTLDGRMGTYLSPVYDSGGADGTYNRLVIQGSFADARLEVIAAATNSLEVTLKNRPEELDRYLAGPDISHSETIQILTALPHVRMVGTQDILLHSLEGRYIWIYIAVYPTGDTPVELDGLRLELPRCTFTQYLPEIYQGNDLFQRYMAVFQSLYLDQERKVDLIPSRLDYRTTEDENLEYLAGWLGIDNSARLLSPAQLRHMIRHLDLYQGKKGAAYALPKILELITGLTPRIVEQFRWDGMSLGPEVRELYGALYGGTCDDYCIILNLMEQRLSVPEEKLERIVEDYNPTGARFRIVYLRPECRSDTHCYMDVNSVLATPEIAHMDEALYDAQNTVG